MDGPSTSQGHYMAFLYLGERHMMFYESAFGHSGITQLGEPSL